MKTSNILVGLLALVVIVFGLRQVDSGRTNALLAEERVRVLEVEREQLEAEFEEAVESYESLRDSLDLAHDSLAKIRDEAKNDALTASLSYNENLTTLRTRVEGQEGLEALLDTLELNHEKEVVAYQEQIATLEADNALLWRRVESLDSMWVREQEVNEVLRLEVAALNEESAAWRSVADKNIFKRIGGAVPYVLAGVAIGSLMSHLR